MEILLALIVLAIFVLTIVVIAIASRFSALRRATNDLAQRLQALEGRGPRASGSAERAAVATPPPLPVTPSRPDAPPPLPVVQPAAATVPAINWESILGVKLFAWIGGLALFLGVVFFIKYAFERNLVTPGMRVGLGGIFGLALIAIGMLPALRRYRVPAQSVCLTGLLIIYADLYAAHSFYGLISLTASTVAMWMVTAAGLALASRLESPALAGLAVVGGFLTPLLLRTRTETAIGVFGYVTIFTCAVAFVGAMKRWTYLLFLAAVGAIVIEMLWAADFFSRPGLENLRFVFLFVQALFLIIAGLLVVMSVADGWVLAGGAATGFATIFAFFIQPDANLAAWDFGFANLLFSAAGMLALAGIYRELRRYDVACAAIAGGTLAFIWVAEWHWREVIFYGHVIDDAPQVVIPYFGHLAAYFAGLFLLFAATPIVCGLRRIWPWLVAAAAGALEFWFFHWSLTSPGWDAGRPTVPHQFLWLLPLAFALVPAIWVIYLVGREKVPLHSGDARLASQGAAVLAFVSLVFPVQFEREWITVGWAIEGLGLVLLYHWIPNRRLRAAALIIFSAAFVRSAFNPWVLEYHPRSAVAIFNWYLYAYGTAALSLFFGARWFGLPQEKEYERRGPALLYSLCGIVCFLLMNIEIADYFSIGPTLTFSFAGNFARDMTYTIAWALFAFGLLVVGVLNNVRSARFAAIGLLSFALLKLFFHDLDALSQLYRIGAFFAVAIVAIVASFIYQRFLAPKPSAR